MTNQNLISEKDIFPTDVDQHIWLADQKKVIKVHKMICDWLANREYLFSEESSIRYMLVGLDKSKDKDKWIRNEISE